MPATYAWVRQEQSQWISKWKYQVQNDITVWLLRLMQIRLRTEAGHLNILILQPLFQVNPGELINQSINLRLLAAWQNAGQKYTKVIDMAIVQELCA